MRYFLQKTCDPVLRSLEKRELFISAHTRRERKGGLGTGITGARAASVKCQNLSIHSTCQNLSIGGVVTIVKSSQSQSYLTINRIFECIILILEIMELRLDLNHQAQVQDQPVILSNREVASYSTNFNLFVY